MRSAHKDVGLQTADMGALVEKMQRAMRKQLVPFAAENKRLASSRR